MEAGIKNIDHLLQELEHKSQLLHPGNMTTLTDLFPILESIASLPGVPSAFKKQQSRVLKMVESSIMGDSPLDLVVSKLREVIRKMLGSLQDVDWQDTLATAVTHKTATNAEREQPTGFDLDLMTKFISNQKIQLDDFEAYVLEMEKGNDAAREEVRRYLHTLKGEFGVLDLPAYSQLVHFIEDSFLANRITMDHLFRFKDWLLSIFPALLQGKPAALCEQDYLQFGVLLEDAPKASSPLGTTSQVEHSHNKEATKTLGLSLKSQLDSSFYIDFITESREHIHTMETKLLDLETDPTLEEPLNAVFRACHTIKGLAGFLDLAEIQKLAHAVESLMDRARNRQLTLTVGHTDLLLMCSDCLKELILQVERTLGGHEAMIPPALEELLNKLHTLDSSAPEPIKAAPSAKLGEILVDSALVPSETIDGALQKQKDGDPRKIGEILMVDDGVSPRTLGQALGAQVQAKQQAQMQSVEESVRVPVNRLDQLIDAIGEAVIAQSMIVADSVITDINAPASIESRDALRRKVARAELIMRQIQELSMSLRMISVKGVFQKMARLVRDLSKKLDKKVDFVMEGENTELDKSVVENIGDPLVHMVRNALDHGVETTEERIASGKPATAKVVLRAFHKAGSVYIEIEDDGRGIHRDKVLKKAVEQGLVPAHANLSDSEVYQLIFRPGFSTAATVTDVSGRGVGMDVVKRNIEALRGSVEITSEMGKGSRFSVRLPLTLAIIDGMVIRVGVERFIVPTLQVIESLKPAVGQVETILGSGEIIRLRKEIFRIVRLSNVLGARSSFKELHEGIILIVEDASGSRFGIAADEILEQQQVVIKNIGNGIAEAPGISGGAIMNNGEVSLILDVSGIARLSRERT